MEFQNNKNGRVLLKEDFHEKFALGNPFPSKDCDMEKVKGAK